MAHVRVTKNKIYMAQAYTNKILPLYNTMRTVATAAAYVA